MEYQILIPFLLFIVAYLYSSVGHGGASGYLAVMGLLAVPTMYMKSSALILNIFVAGIASYYFIKNKHLNRRLLLPFLITSVPAAFIGAMFTLNDVLYKQILAFCLFIAAIRIIYKPGKVETETQNPPLMAALFSGALIGAVSGMIGIGGGVLLSPLILFFKWGKFKEAAATSAVFILVNSVSGLLGSLQKGIALPDNFYFWILAALSGGLAGSYWGSIKASNIKLKYVLSVVLIFATLKLIL